MKNSAFTSGIFHLSFIIHHSSLSVIRHGKLNIVVLIYKATAQILVPAVDGARAALAFYVFVRVGRLDYISAALALDRVFDDLCHNIASIKRRYTMRLLDCQACGQ